MKIIKPIPEVQVYANKITFKTPEELDAAPDLIIASPSKAFMDHEHNVTFFDDSTIELKDKSSYIMFLTTKLNGTVCNN